MPFYSTIAKAYDELFPLNPNQTDFVESSFGGSVAGKHLVDAGCGTGSLAIMLARRSARVFAFDSDEQMIKTALEKQPQALNLKFKQGELIGELYAFMHDDIDAVICFGNTLVHLTNIEKTEQFIKRSSEVLKPGGKLLLQIVNYARVLNNKVDSLPDIETGRFKFIRKYKFRPDRLIDFKTLLTDKISGERIENNVCLYPLQKDELEQIINKYFKILVFYGDFKKSPFSDESFHLIAEAVK
ncbi:MAG: class I SAM-dependent methyltransferase [Chlorobi bacterium]|nr:class I SAM-dependent methyltransferase [Chlorobiota bacterium]